MNYKKILEGVVNIINTTKKSDIGFANICSYIGENCPELKESEDEKIRKEIIAFLKENFDTGRAEETWSLSGLERWITWLEKQGEKSPVDKVEKNPVWSEEDDRMVEAALQFAHEYGRHGLWCWLKDLKDRVQPQPKQEWSKEDEQYLLVCKNALAKYQVSDKWDATIISRWLEDKLKSLRPQSQWKPSDEQMKVLDVAIKNSHLTTAEYDGLAKLREQLKKLREE